MLPNENINKCILLKITNPLEIFSVIQKMYKEIMPKYIYKELKTEVHEKIVGMGLKGRSGQGN